MYDHSVYTQGARAWSSIAAEVQWLGKLSPLPSPRAQGARGLNDCSSAPPQLQQRGRRRRQEGEAACEQDTIPISTASSTAALASPRRSDRGGGKGGS